MDVHDGLGTDDPHTMWEPPGHESSTSTGEDTHGYDGYGDGTGHDSAGGYDDSTTGSGDAAEPADGSAAGSTATAGAGSGSGDTGGIEGSTTMAVEVEGQTRELPAEHDYTGDGRPDAAVETEDGKVIVFADTEDNATGAAGPDGKADEAYIVDKQSGQVVGAAHIDPGSGTWVEGTDPDGPSAGGDASSGDRPTDGAETTTTGGSGSSGGQHSGGVVTVEYDGHQVGVEKTIDTAGTSTGTMTVDLGGRTQQLPAEKDYTGDGQADAAVETRDGQVIVFADTENNETGAAGPDGRADEAWIVDKSTGQVVGAAHVDPRTGEWVDGAAPDGPSSVPTGSEATD